MQIRQIQPIQSIKISEFICNLFLPEDYHAGNRTYPVIYVNGDVPIQEIISEVNKAGYGADFIMLSVQPGSWNDDFTPWSAPAFHRGEKMPAGLADAYICHLTGEIKPYMDAHYRTMPEAEHTALFGYSLGGLTTVYTLYKTDVFGVVGSLSGSLWYDGFGEFMESNEPLKRNAKVYLSLGKKEKQSRNPRMSRVAECTERAKDILTKQLTQTVCFEWNEGGHFDNIPKRFAKAVVWWMKTGSDV